jgi:hypothetical protein
VARWYENLQESEEEHEIAAAVGINVRLAEVETAQPEDLDIPACLRRCAQCGEPSNPDKGGAVTPRDIGGVWHWLHPRCDFEF